MAFVYKQLYATTTIAASNVAIVTNTTGKKYIRTVIFYNYHATNPVNVKLFNVAAGGSGVPANQIFGTNVAGETNLDPGQTVIWEIPIPGLVLETNGATLQVWASAGTTANVTVIGAEE